MIALLCACSMLDDSSRKYENVTWFSTPLSHLIAADPSEINNKMLVGDDKSWAEKNVESKPRMSAALQPGTSIIWRPTHSSNVR